MTNKIKNDTKEYMKPNLIPSPIADDRLELLFRHAGLSEKQAKLYRLLLERGEERPSILSQKSGIKRTNAYALLEDMTQKGLVTKFEKGKILYFRPEPPEKLTSIIEGREKEVKLAKSLAGDLLPHLTSQWKTAVNRPTIQYIEGEEGIKTVFEDIYATKTEPVYGCVDLEKSASVFPDYVTKTLIPKRIKNNVYANSFIAKSPEALEVHNNDIYQLRTSILLDRDSYPLPAEIDVYEDKIAMLSFEKGEFIGIIIQNQAFAQSLKSIFKKAFGNTVSPHPQSTLPGPQPSGAQA